MRSTTRSFALTLEESRQDAQDPYGTAIESDGP